MADRINIRKLEADLWESATDSANKDRSIREKLLLTGDIDVMASAGMH